MKLHNDLGSKNIKEAIDLYPRIGEILDKYGIGCINCTIGGCLVENVVSVHCLGDETEALIEREINAYLDESGATHERNRCPDCSPA